MEQAAAAETGIHAQRLVEIADQMLDPAMATASPLPPPPRRMIASSAGSALNRQSPQTKGVPSSGKAAVVPGVEFVARVVVPDELVRIAGGVDEIAVLLQLGQDDVHPGSLLGDQEHGDRRHGPVAQAAPGEGRGRGG